MMLEKLLSMLELPFTLASEMRLRSKGQPVADETGIGVTEEGQLLSFTAKDLARHSYILGATGCGKTTLILHLVREDLKNEHSIVIVDLRGDLVSGAISLCAELQIDPSRLYILDLRDKSGPVGFNPLSGAGEPYIRALHVLDVVATEAESWGIQLEETLRSALLLLASSGGSLVDLERVFYDSVFRKGLVKGVTDQSVASFWDRYDDLSSERQQALAMPVLNKVTSLLAVPTLRSVLGHASPVDLEEVLDTPGSVLLISLAVDELHRSSRMLGSLLISAISREMMARVNVPESSRNPVRLYVDEFENMASASFEGLVAEGRRFGFTLVLSHQTLAQIAPKLRSMIRNNVGLQLIFQCGYEDARLIARELPKEIEASALRALEVGQAFLMRRDGSSVRVQFHRPPKKTLPRTVAQYRALLSKPSPSEPKIEIEELPTSNAAITKLPEEWL